ncbi:hypothetical protein AAC387_Pa09g1028 [Persea americana]
MEMWDFMRGRGRISRDSKGLLYLRKMETLFDYAVNLKAFVGVCRSTSHRNGQGSRRIQFRYPRPVSSFQCYHSLSAFDDSELTIILWIAGIWDIPFLSEFFSGSIFSVTEARREKKSLRFACQAEKVSSSSTATPRPRERSLVKCATTSHLFICVDGLSSTLFCLGTGAREESCILFFFSASSQVRVSSNSPNPCKTQMVRCPPGFAESVVAALGR